MSIVSEIKPLVAKTLKDLYGQEFNETDLTISGTKPEFEGDYTIVLFSLVKPLKTSPEKLGMELGEALVKANPALFTAFNVIKGFLNLTVADNYWTGFLDKNLRGEDLRVPTSERPESDGGILLSQHQ
jgi:Arginyl-tRNA synthetase